MLILIFLLVLPYCIEAQTCELPTAFNCSSLSNICQGASTIISSVNTNYNCPYPLNLTANNIQIQGNFTGLQLTGQSITASSLIVTTIFNISLSNNIVFSGTINLGVLYIIGQDGTNSSLQWTQASIYAQKIVAFSLENLAWSNSNITTSWFTCLYQKIHISQVDLQFQNTSSITIDGLNACNFSLFIGNVNNMIVSNTQIVTTSLAFLATQSIVLNSSILNTSTMGCKSNTGKGRGCIIQYKSTLCTTGASSCGYGVASNNELCAEVIPYFLFLSHSFPYMTLGPYLNMGSGGFGYNLNNNGRGAGGGIIFILSQGSLTLINSQIIASGGDVYVQDNLSAGSAGTIFITGTQIIGNGYNFIVAAGGNSYNGNGAGSGGLIKLSSQNVTRQFPTSLWIDINQGNQSNNPSYSVSNNGIFYGPLCYGGQQMDYLQCGECPYNYYSTLGDTVCRPCPFSSILQLDKSITGKSLVSQCYLVDYQTWLNIWFTPGQVVLISVPYYLAALIIFAIIGGLLKRKQKKQRQTPENQFKFDDILKDLQQTRNLAIQLRKSKNIRSHELMYHLHRISCFGNNTVESPWVLPGIVPNQIKKYVLTQVFSNFAQSFSKEAKWTSFERFVASVLKLYYPVYWYYIDHIKKKKYKKLNIMLQSAKDYNLINNYDYEDKSIVTIKFSKNKDYTNCYLDFFLYQKADIKYFKLSTPFLIYLSGEGNFLRPFYLEEDDIFFRALFFAINRNLGRIIQGATQKQQLFTNMISQKTRLKNCAELNKFLKKLNALACTIDFCAPEPHVICRFRQLVDFVRKWNQKLFNKNVMHVDLVLMLSHMFNGKVIDNQIQILTANDRSQFQKIMLIKLQQVQKWQQSSLKLGLFVYNPEQQIPREDQWGEVSQNVSMLDQQSVPQVIQVQEPKQQLIENLIIDPQFQKKSKCQAVLNKIDWILGIMRYYLLSHQTTHYDQYTIKFLQSFFILIQTLLVFMWSVKVQIPYIIINLICPLIGVIWFVSDSYGIGKLYMIFNAMNLLNQIVTIIAYSIIWNYVISSNQQMQLITENIICAGINIILIGFMLFVGSRALTLSKKLSFQKERKKPQPVSQ